MIDKTGRPSPYRAAIIGLGNIAWKYDAGTPDRYLTHRSAYEASSDAHLVIGYDPSAAQRDAFVEQTGIPATDSLEALLETGPDLVSICSPSGLHACQLEACLRAKIPMIWLEKPATTSASETVRLAALQREMGKSTVLVNYQRRYLPAYRRLKELVAGRELGELKVISLTYSRGLQTNGIHLLDLLFFLREVQPYELARLPGPVGPEDSPSFLLRFADGVTCTVTGVDIDHHSIDATLHFSAGRASVLYGGVSETRETRIENPLFPGFFRLKPTDDGTCSDSQLAAETVSVMPMMLADLIAAHRGNREPASSLQSSLAAQELTERVLGVKGGE